MAETLQYMNTNIMTNAECTLRARVLGNLDNIWPTVPIIYPGHVCTFERRGVGVCGGMF